MEKVKYDVLYLFFLGESGLHCVHLLLAKVDFMMHVAKVIWVCSSFVVIRIVSLSRISFCASSSFHYNIYSYIINSFTLWIFFV